MSRVSELSVQELAALLPGKLKIDEQQSAPLADASGRRTLRVLILGEGNGTFASSQSLPDVFFKYLEGYDKVMLFVTDNIPEHEWKASHPGMYERLVARAYVVKFGVDARNTDMVKDKELIILLFPYVSGAQRKEATVKLIVDTMKNIVLKADCGTLIWIGLATPKDNTFQPWSRLQYGRAVPDILDECIAESMRIPGCDQCLSYERNPDSLLDNVKGYVHIKTSTRQPYAGLWNENTKEVYGLKVVKRSDANSRMIMPKQHEAARRGAFTF